MDRPRLPKAMIREADSEYPAFLKASSSWAVRSSVCVWVTFAFDAVAFSMIEIFSLRSAAALKSHRL